MPRSSLSSAGTLLATPLVLLCGVALLLGVRAGPAAAQELRPPEAFADIADQRARSVALFEEAGKVIQHPRCMNCHPAGDRPLQGDEGRPHQPLVVRGEANIGVPGLYCATCHQPQNYDPARVPGNPKWALAPIEMAWVGKSLGEICTQIKDPARNHDMDIPALVEHMGHDELVGWAWAPGPGRTPAPGTQAAFGALIQAWADTGAACPS